jgi:hypothetical protein
MIDSSPAELSDEKNEQIDSSSGCRMNLLTIRTGLSAATLAAVLLAIPAESHAIFHWFSRCCGGATPTYGTAPLYGAPAAAVDPCAPPQVTQTASYLPQTCYRTQYVSVPVTTYRPVVSRDPCTGCPVTCMRPATCMVQQAQLVPYTTYRRVLSNPCCGAAAPTIPAYTSGYLPAYSAGAGYATGSSCSGCSAAAPMTYAPTTSTPYYGSATSGTVVSPSNGYPASNGYPVSNGFPAANSYPTNGISSGTPTPAPGASQRTFQSEKPIPKAKDEQPGDDNGNGDKSSDTGSTSGAGTILSPRLFQPNDRTTSYPILRAQVHRPVSYNEPTLPAEPQRKPLDDDGWRPSAR